MLTAVMLMVACTSEDFVGDERLHEANENGRPVSFSLIAAPQTRAVYGQDAAELLNNQFVVWGDKKVSGATQTVFNNYQVNYTVNSAGTTTTNSAGWEYTGISNQTVKFWDYSASEYNFFAYSLGKGATTTSTPPTATYAQPSGMTSSGYTLTGTAEALNACYISNKKTITPSASSGTEVELQFLHFGSNVKMAFYETIPGYSVKEMKFYPSDSEPAETVPYLYASAASLPTGGTYTVTFDANGAAQVSAPTGTTNVANMAFGTDLTYTAENDYREDSGIKYIGRSLNQATPTDAVTVLPNPDGSELNLKVDYTLLSRDGNGEEIKVTGATATVPATFAKWQPNNSYTYIFKISDNTNGAVGSIIGLRPITLDAVVNTDADGRQETVTTVTEPSITTYQKGSDYAVTNEYKAGTIYVVVTQGGVVKTLTTTGDINAKLYTVTIEEGAAQSITEMTVANAISSGTHDVEARTWTLTDANNKKLTVTAEDGLSAMTDIPAEDAPAGEAVTVDGATFTASAGTTYVFEYIDATVTPAVSYYKVIKVASGS